MQWGAIVAVFRGKLAAFVAIPSGQVYQELSALITKVFEGDEVEIVPSPCTFTPDLLEKCRKADFLIADITEVNPSTYYVVGASHAMQKPVLLLCQEGSSELEEISGVRIVRYTPGRIQRLSEFLGYWLKDIGSEQRL